MICILGSAMGFIFESIFESNHQGCDVALVVSSSARATLFHCLGCSTLPSIRLS